MVRRGSTVRVRQRALQNPRKTGLLLSVPLAQPSACGRYGALYGAFRSRTPSSKDRRDQVIARRRCPPPRSPRRPRPRVLQSRSLSERSFDTLHAVEVGITERTAAQIVGELEEAGYLTKTRDGRRNRYQVHGELPLRHPQHRHHTVGELIRFLDGSASPRRRQRRS
jgi:hypothetical protein